MQDKIPNDRPFYVLYIGDVFEVWVLKDRIIVHLCTDPKISKASFLRVNQDANGATGSCKNTKDELNASKGRNGSLDEEEIPCAGPASCFSPPEWQVCWDGIGWDILWGILLQKFYEKASLLL